MTKFRALLGAVGFSMVVTASVLAFVTLSIPGVRDNPRLGLVAVAVFVAVAAAFACALLRRK